MSKHCHRARFIARSALEQRVAIMRAEVDAAARHDADGIHDLRVASRRLRAVLDDLDAQFKKKALKPFRRRIKSITQGLGKARELDVTLALMMLYQDNSRSPLQQQLETVQRALRGLRDKSSADVDQSCAKVREDAFQNEYTALENALKCTERCYLKQAAETLQDRLDDLVRAHKRWQKSSSEECLHAVRIAFKQFRYSCEINKGVYGEHMEKILEQLKGAQEALGEWNDYRIARDYAHSEERLKTRSRQSHTELGAVLDGRANESMSRFSADADAFFSKGALGQLRRALRKPAVPCCAHGTSSHWKKKGSA